MERARTRRPDGLDGQLVEVGCAQFVAGVRAEQTNIDARASTDPTRNLQRDAAGKFILGANGQPLTIIPEDQPLTMRRASLRRSTRCIG